MLLQALSTIYKTHFKRQCMSTNFKAIDISFQMNVALKLRVQTIFGTGTGMEDHPTGSNPTGRQPYRKTISKEEDHTH